MEVKFIQNWQSLEDGVNGKIAAMINEIEHKRKFGLFEIMEELSLCVPDLDTLQQATKKIINQRN